MKFTTHDGQRHFRGFAAAAALAGSLALSLSGSAVAAQQLARGVPRDGAAVAEVGAEEAMRSAAAAAGPAAKCGKCHSPCEEGANHTHVERIGNRGSELPLDPDGLIGCITCHDPHRDGSEARGESRLRISNLRRELCLACHGQGAEEGPAVQIVSPLEGAVVLEDRVALIGRALRLPETRVTVRLNGSPFDLQVKDGRFFTWLSLQDGVNRVAVAQEDRILWTGELFRGGDAADGYGRTSSGHGTANREECLGCHLKTGGVSPETAGAGPTLCYACHERNDGKRYVHGPLAVGDCLVCHDPHGGLGSAHLRSEQGLLCRGCHPSRNNSPKVACESSEKGCVGCHDPHQSNARYLLKGPQYSMLAEPARAR